MAAQQRKPKKKWVRKGMFKVAVLQYNLDGELIKEWESLTLAARSVGIHPANISTMCRGNPKNWKQIKGFVWKFKNKGKQMKDKNKKQ